MEKELFFSGYCRTTDASRMVEVVVDGTELVEVDCCYENCAHAPNCTIAASIREATES